MGQKPSHSHYEKFKDEDGVEIPYPQEEHEQSTTNCCEACCDRCCHTILWLCIMRSL